MALLFVLLIALPIAELAVLVQVAGSVGVLNAVGLLIAVSVVGAWLAKQQGFGVLNRMRQTQAAGKTPSKELADGALLLLAAVLLIVPGFITDVVGILLLLPPIRAAVRAYALHRMAKSGRIMVVGGRSSSATGSSDEVWDVDSWESPPEPRTPPGGRVGSDGRGQIGGGS